MCLRPGKTFVIKVNPRASEICERSRLIFCRPYRTS
ncbi:unnamed protein product [Victoria cruziana]